MNTCVSYRPIIINKRLSVIKREKREKKGEKKIRYQIYSNFKLPWDYYKSQQAKI